MTMRSWAKRNRRHFEGAAYFSCVFMVFIVAGWLDDQRAEKMQTSELSRDAGCVALSEAR